MRYNQSMATRKRMQWSRLKKMLESRFCEKFSDRVQIHMARYTDDEEVGRIWFVLDKQQIFSAGDMASPSHPKWYLEDGCVYYNSPWGRSYLERFLLSYLSLSIEEALASPEELTKALAMFDKRVGKRRLQELAREIEGEPLLVKHFYKIRCQAEELQILQT